MFGSWSSLLDQSSTLAAVAFSTKVREMNTCHVLPKLLQCCRAAPMLLFILQWDGSAQLSKFSMGIGCQVSHF